MNSIYSSLQSVSAAKADYPMSFPLTSFQFFRHGPLPPS
jgi:membrane-anchored protein YejM (alkaline phosphatase superfamily)